MNRSEHLRTCSSSGCSQSAVISFCWKWYKEGTALNQRQGHGWPQVNDAHGQLRLARMVWSSTQATAYQIVHHSLLQKNVHSHRSVRVPMLTSIHKFPQWVHEQQNRTMNDGRRWPHLMNQVFFYIMWIVGFMCIAHMTGKCHGLKTNYVSKHWRPCAPVHGKSTPCWLWTLSAG